jgi:hypothetical protein
MTTTTLARLVAPHVVGALDVALVAKDHELAARGVPAGKLDGDLAYRCDTRGVHVTASSAGPGTVSWDEIAGIVRAGITPARVAAVEDAQAAFRDRQADRDEFLDACPWRTPAGRTPEAEAESRRIAREIALAWTRVADAVAVIVNAGIDPLDDSQLGFDGLDAWLAGDIGALP